MEEALCVAGALDFVSALDHGLGTLVGDRGARFSGGQRQRLSMARAIFGKPDLLVLDEATNAVDVASAGLEIHRQLTGSVASPRPQTACDLS